MHKRGWSSAAMKCRVRSLRSSREGKDRERVEGEAGSNPAREAFTIAQDDAASTLSKRGYGGIGRRSGLKIHRRKAYRFESCYPHHAGVAQLAEQLTRNEQVVGSSPTFSSISWSRAVAARVAHNHEVGGSNPSSATSTHSSSVPYGAGGLFLLPAIAAYRQSCGLPGR